jgi:hypothetical protein
MVIVTTPLLEECEDDTHIPEMGHSSDILSIRFKHTRILRIFGLFFKYFKILYTKANFQAFVFL